MGKIIQFWGLCDLLAITFYLSSRLIKGQIPIYFELSQTYQSTLSFGHPLPFFLLVPVILLYISFFFSGKLLYQQNIKAAIICYIQTPFRLISAAPSLFFIHWPIAYLFNNPPVILGIILITLSEIFKLATVIPWHLKMRKDLITRRCT